MPTENRCVYGLSDKTSPAECRTADPGGVRSAAWWVFGWMSGGREEEVPSCIRVDPVDGGEGHNKEEFGWEFVSRVMD